MSFLKGPPFHSLNWECGYWKIGPDSLVIMEAKYNDLILDSLGLEFFQLYRSAMSFVGCSSSSFLGIPWSVSYHQKIPASQVTRVQNKFIKALFKDSCSHLISVFLGNLEKAVFYRLTLGICEMLYMIYLFQHSYHYKPLVLAFQLLSAIGHSRVQLSVNQPS